MCNVDEESIDKFMKDIPVESLMGIVEETYEDLLKGTNKKKIFQGIISKDFNRDVAGLVLDICLTRKKSKGKFTDHERLYFTSEGLRWATPEIAADHCAGRMERYNIADLTCGQGGQVISFSRVAEKVIAVDIDPLNCLITRMNLRSLGIENVEVINSDCLSQSVMDRLDDRYVLFSDPARPEGSRERTMDEIVPDPRQIERAYRDTVPGMCFEIPPYMSLERIKFDHEAEYISIDGRINRLNIYLGELKKANRSSVVLPSGGCLTGEPFPIEEEYTPENMIGSYINEVDPTVVASGLLGNLIKENGWRVSSLKLDHRRTLLLSKNLLSSPFIKSSYEVLGIADTVPELKGKLREAGAGFVTLRYSVKPRDYWKIRNDLEEKLEGKIKVSVFRKGDYIMARKISEG